MTGAPPADDAGAPTLVVGLDGADFRYLDRFADDLPALSSLRERGVETPLRATHPPWTGSAWPSVYTGVDPAHHGVFDFFDYREAYPDEAPVVDRNDVDAPAVWNYLTDRGVPSVVVNVPVTHPAEPVAGVLVPGYLGAADEPCHPRGTRQRLREALGHPYHVYSEFETAPASDRKIAGYVDLVQERAAAASHLLATEDWQFAMVQVQKTDAVFHNSTDPADFRRVYRAADDLVAALLEACERPVNVLVCSDHGIGPVTGYDVCVNDVLAAHGLVEATHETTDRSLVRVKESGDDDERSEADATAGRSAGAAGGDSRTGGTDADQPDVLERALRAGVATARRVGVEPGSVYRLLRRVGVADDLAERLPADLKRSAVRGVDWRSSRAYCRRGSEQGVRVNLAGRDPDGVVDPGEYEAVRTAVMAALSELETPEGEPVFEFVRRREAVHDGPHAEAAPDVCFRTTDMNHTVLTQLYGTRTVPTESFSHKQRGVFLAAGPDVDVAWDGGELALPDVAPVAFALLGRPVPDRTTGSVPPDLVGHAPTRADYGDVAFARGDPHDRDEAAVHERLRDMGYL
jgi:predicted AlkP superfamily phosphohydrolase/phosphomutase